MTDYVAQLLDRWKAGLVSEEQVFQAAEAAGATDEVLRLLDAKIAHHDELDEFYTEQAEHFRRKAQGE